MVRSHKDWIMKGYKYIYRPDYPSSHKGGILDGRILEHRLIAEEMLGRPLEKSESVHHIDRNRVNNDPSNLMILDSKSHSLLHKLEQNHIVPIMDSIEFAHSGKGIEFGHPQGLGKNGANVKEEEHLHCTKCGRALGFKITSSHSKTGLCAECLKEHNAAHIPSREALMEELRGKSMEEVGRAHGVTGKAIKKWAIKRGIDIRGLTKPVGFTEEAISASHTPEAYAKGAKSLKEYWKSHEHPSSKAVEQLDENGNVVAVFDSAVKAATTFGCNDGSPVVRACLHNRTYKGFRFRYKT